MVHVFLVDGLRTPIGRYGGALAPVRPDDLAALVLREILDRHLNFRPARWTKSSSAVPTRPGRTTATSPGWHCC